MKNAQKNAIHHFATCFLIGLSLIWMLSSGCSKAPSNSEVAQAPPGEPIQGEPIQGDPIESEITTPVEETNQSADTEEQTEDEPVVGPQSPDNAITLNVDQTKDGEKETEEIVTEISASTTNTVVASESASIEQEIQTAANEINPAELLEKPLVETTLPDASGYLSVSFDKLASFEYQMPEDLTEPVADDDGKIYKEQIPADIKALNAKDISLKGFMLPLKVEKGLVTEMLIMRDQSMCCYGTVPKINEWVSVRMDEKGVKPIMDEAVTIYGKLQVGEVLENGYLVGIYEMAGQKMDDHSAN